MIFREERDEVSFYKKITINYEAVIIVSVVHKVAELELQAAASFWWNNCRSHNVIRLRLPLQA
jgi:hypothetical protein